MKHKKFLILFPLFALAFGMLACATSVSTANISDAWMASDDSGSNRVSSYAPDAPVFYALVQLNNAPDDTTVKAVWIAVKVEGVDPDFKIDETTITTGKSPVHFTLENNNPLWPSGDYKVDIYLNDKLDKTITFSVK